MHKRLLFLIALLITCLAQASDRYDAMSYPRIPDLENLIAVSVTDDASLTAALEAFGTSYAAASHYILCKAGSRFTSDRILSKSGTLDHPLIIVGHQTDGDFTMRAELEKWTIKGSHVWLCGLKILPRGNGSSYSLSILGAAHGTILTQSWITARNGIVVDDIGGIFPRDVHIGWNHFTGKAINNKSDGDDLIKFEVGETVKPEGARIYRNLIETDEQGMNDESMCIINRPGRRPDVGPYMEDFLVLENWIRSGRTRAIYLKHGGEIIRNVAELTGNGLTFALRGRGTAHAKMNGNIAVDGYAVVVQGEYNEVMGNDFSGMPNVHIGCKFLNNDSNPNSIASGADYSVIAGNKGRLRLATYNNKPLAPLTNLTIEAHEGDITDRAGNILLIGDDFHPVRNDIPNVESATITVLPNTERDIPALTTITREDCGPASGDPLAQKKKVLLKITDEAPIIDGEAEDVYGDDSVLENSYNPQWAPETSRDLAATWKAVLGTDYLYLFTTVYDRSPVFLNPALDGEFQFPDRITLFLDSQPLEPPSISSPSQWRIDLTPRTDDTVLFFASSNGGSPENRHILQNESSGTVLTASGFWTMEVKLPLAPLGLIPLDSTQLGMDLLTQVGFDEQGFPEFILHWSSEDNPVDNPVQWGLATLDNQRPLIEPFDGQKIATNDPWIYSPWLGWYYQEGSDPYYNSATLGWFYYLEITSDWRYFYLYDTSAWIYVYPPWYPWVYSYASGTWVEVSQQAI